MAGKRGKVAETALPPVKRSKYDWVLIVEMLRREPGRWVMVPDVSNGHAAKLAAEGNRWLNALGGTIRVHQRNTRPVKGPRGTSRRGDLWLQWEPEGWVDDRSTHLMIEEAGNV